MAAHKILIVEDEQAIREMIAFHLSRAGYETLEAADRRQIASPRVIRWRHSDVTTAPE